VNALTQPAKTGVNALTQPAKTGVNALMQPAKTGVNALMRATGPRLVASSSGARSLAVVEAGDDEGPHLDEGRDVGRGAGALGRPQRR
jgi:hypothetical protein